MMNAVNNIAAALAATSSGKSDGGLIKATVVRGPSGEGVFTLRLSGGREIGVQVQADGGGAALEPGQKVLLSPSDGKIFIPTADTAEADQPMQSQQWAQAQQPAQMRQAAQMLLQQVQGGGDLFVSGKQQAEAAEAGAGGGADGAKGATGQDMLAKIVGFKVVSEGEAHADGIYRADAAGHILEGPADGEAPIKDFAAVRLSTINGQQVVTVLAGDGLSAAIEDLRGSFESPLLRALPLELLKDIFNERGFLDTDTLKALDAALVNRNLSIDTSSQFQMERIGQWLRIALDNPGMAQELVDRIPALGAKDAAGLLELIGRLSSGVSPESFFATGQTLPRLGAIIGGGADLLQSLVKAAFSEAPNALLNLVKQIDTSSVMLGAQLPPTEAARVVREITNVLPAQAAAKPGSLHDAGQMSPRVLETNAAPAPKIQTPASAVPQIRAGYSELTEATVRVLLGGGGKADAAAVGERINALREAVARMPVTPPSSNGQGHDTAAARDGGISGNRAESNAAAANTQSAASRLSVLAGGTNANAAKAPEAFPHVNAQLAVHRASSVPSGDINASVGSAKVDAYPAVNRGFAPQQPQQPQQFQQSSAQTGGIGTINNHNIRGDGDVNRSIPVDSIRGMGINVSGINTSGVNSTDNQNIRGDVGVNNRQVAVDNSRGVNNPGGININSNAKSVDNIGNTSINVRGINTNSVNTNNINPADNQNIRGDAGVYNRQGAVDNSRDANNSGNVGINTNSNAKPIDNVDGMGVNVRGINTNSVNTNNINPTDNRNIRGDVGVNNSQGVIDNTRGVNNSGGIGINTNSNARPVDNVGGMGINARGINTIGINPADNQNIRGGIGVDNSRGVNTSGINFADNQNIRGVNNSGGIGINTTGTAPVNVPAIKESCLSIVDTLKSSAAPILRELAQRGEIRAGGGASLIGLVREAVSSLDEALRPLVRSERPVPPEFYERVAAGAGHRISAEAKNALFSQIGSAQALIRGAVESVERVNSGISASIKSGVSTSVSSGVNTNVGASINPNINTVASVNPSINTGVGINSGINANVNPNVNMGINSGINPGINTNTNTGVNPNINQNLSANANVNHGINTHINPVAGTNVNPGVNPTINRDANPGANPNVSTGVNVNVNANANPGINANVNQTVNPSAGANVNTIDTNANVNPNANINTAANTGGRPDEFLQIARRIWANTEKLRAGFREAFSTLDLQNRASPLDKPVDDSTAGTVRRSADTLRTEMLLDVSRALRDVFSSVDELREIVSQLSSGQMAMPETEAALLRAVQALEHQSRQSGAEVMERLKDLLRELNRLQADAARAQEQGAAAAARTSPAEAIRSAALTAARSLENLQLLSTQTRTAETEQHLLALPAKIGGEWTEVQIKFVKERKGEKGGNKDGHVSIYLNVAPSALGQVTAHLDYHPPNLKLAFQFEKPEVTRWFRQQSGELREALSQVGLPGTVLEFNNRRPISGEPATSARQPIAVETGGVDQADVFEVKNGRVDFKI
jgi:hypothetical protein